MLDLRGYRLAFAPTLAALVVLAFSLDGMPEPIEPGPVTLAFEGGRAAAAARDVVAEGPTRAPGSEGDLAAADYVRERFEALESGTVAEQEFEASIDGDDVTLRNVSLTLPGPNERLIVVLAGRDARDGPGVTTSAAATGTLLELAQQLGVADRQRTLLLASTDAASAGAEGALELLGALPDPDLVDAVIVISQPSAADPAEPHLILSSTGDGSTAIELSRTMEAQLEERAGVAAGLDGTLGQLARLALPGAAGEQAALIDQGFDALAISSAGEVPLAPEHDDPDALDPDALGRYGAAMVATIGALDSRPAGPVHGPEAYLRTSQNLIPGWAVGLLALALLVPPAVLATAQLARSGKSGGSRQALSWAAGWLAPPLAALAALFLAGVVGLVPAPPAPFDPGRFGIGPTEVVALAILVAVAAGAWWALGLRRVPTQPTRATLAAACAAVSLASTLLVWTANPFLALLMVPVAHMVGLLGLSSRAARHAALPALMLSLLPLVAALAHVGSQLDWGASAPWQVALLFTGGGAGVVAPVAALGAIGAACALAWAIAAPSRRRERDRGPNRPISPVEPPPGT